MLLSVNLLLVRLKEHPYKGAVLLITYEILFPVKLFLSIFTKQF